MSNGKVIDDGSPDVLRNRPGLYRDLLAKQHGRHHAAPDSGAATGERVA